MVDIKNIVQLYRKMSIRERAHLLDYTEEVQAALAELPDEESAKHTLAGFILGSAYMGGIIKELDLLFMYPDLVKVFGEGYDFDAAKKKIISRGREGQKDIFADMYSLLGEMDDISVDDTVLLCLAIMFTPGKGKIGARKYIRQFIRSCPVDKQSNLQRQDQSVQVHDQGLEAPSVQDQGV